MKHLTDTQSPILLIDSDDVIHHLFGRMIAHPSDGSAFKRMDVPSLELLQEQLISTFIIGIRPPIPDGMEQSLEQFAANHSCWIVIDHAMRETGVLDFVQRLKENPKTRAIPIIILNGKSLSKNDVARLQKANVIFETKQVLNNDELISQILNAKDEQGTLHFKTSALVKQTITYIMENYIDDISRQDLAQQMGISQDYLSRVFHKEIGVSPWEFINRYRVIKAKELLERDSTRITTVATQVGFNDPAYFSRVFQKLVGCSPKVYRDRAIRHIQ